MSHNRATHRAIVLAAALAVAGIGVVPIRAAQPSQAADPSTVDVTPDRAAWDKQTPDDGTQLIVEFRTKTALAQRHSVIAAADATRITDVPGAGVSVVRVDPGQTQQAIATIGADRSVLSVSVDHRRFRDADPRDEPFWGELWGLHNTGQNLFLGEPGTGGTNDVDIDGLQALGLTHGDPSVVVAVIDDGVDFSHPDLAGRAWTNPGESGGGKETNGIDDDGNGYIDDVHGWDFCHNDNTVHDFDDDFHGTHVAGTIAASLNGIGVVGVAPNVSIMALKFINGTNACGHDSQAIAAIAYAKSFGVHIANASWGGPGDRSFGQKMGASPLYDAIASSGLLFVTAAGNDGINNDTDAHPSLPAAFDLPNILSVAALDNNGGLADFSNVGHRSVDIAAPGVDVLSAQPADSSHAEPFWTWFSGTSMATPHVSGSAALVASMSPSLAADPVALKARLLATGKPMPLTSGDTASGRMVDAYRALDTNPPTAVAPNSIGFALGSVIGKTTALARVRWPAGTDDLTGVAGYGVQVQANGGAWATVTSSTAARSADRIVSFGSTYAFRVRARDGAGNWGAYKTSPTARPKLFEESSSLVSYHGSWTHPSSSTASGGKTRASSHAGASATFHFNGRAFAVIMPKGSTRGQVKFYLDGASVATIDLHRTTTASRVVVATGWWAVPGTHTVKLVVVGTHGHPRVDIDAFAVMR